MKIFGNSHLQAPVTASSWQRRFKWEHTGIIRGIKRDLEIGI